MPRSGPRHVLRCLVVSPCRTAVAVFVPEVSVSITLLMSINYRAGGQLSPCPLRTMSCLFWPPYKIDVVYLCFVDGSWVSCDYIRVKVQWVTTMKNETQECGRLHALCREYGGQLLVQNGHDLPVPQVPPRTYWLLFDHPAQLAQNQIRSAARIDDSWGMTLRLSREPEYKRTIDSLSFTYVLNGRGIFRDASRQYDVGEGDLLTLFPGVPHVYGPLPGERWDEITVFLGGPIFEAWVQTGLLDPQQPLHHMEPVSYWLERFHQVHGVKKRRRRKIGGVWSGSSRS